MLSTEKWGNCLCCGTKWFIIDVSGIKWAKTFLVKNVRPNK